MDHVIDTFWDADNGGFYFTDIDHESLITRTKDYFDNATPSGNSVAADVLVRLGALLGRSDLTENGGEALRVNRCLACAIPFRIRTASRSHRLSSGPVEGNRHCRLPTKLDTHSSRPIENDTFLVPLSLRAKAIP
jgi:uncharacterized protein YyaL (SSP411 family)